MMDAIKQFVPEEVCLKCDICCRYPERASPYAPYFLRAEGLLDAIGKKIDPKPAPIAHGRGFACRFFMPDKNACSIYPARPLDCQLYPFMVTYNPDYDGAYLVLDKNCPYAKEKQHTEEFSRYASYLKALFEEKDVIEKLNSDKPFINPFQENSVVIRRLEGLSKRLCLTGTGLKKLSIKDKDLFEARLKDANPAISSFSFASIYIWGDSLNILWKEIDGYLCVFAGDTRNYFLFLPPIGSDAGQDTFEKAFEILHSINGPSKAARIENVPPELAEKLEDLDYKLMPASCEYIYGRKRLAELKGDGFKSKRSALNRLSKNEKCLYRPLAPDDIFDCLELYREWAGQRLALNKNEYFRYLIEDSYFAHKIALFDYEALGLCGRAVELGGKISAYTLGYPLNKNTFVILFETANLKIKGLSQFIFREFCAELMGFEYINTLGDSDLENLKKAKESYKPIKKIPVFTAYPVS